MAVLIDAKHLNCLPTLPTYSEGTWLDYWLPRWGSCQANNNQAQVKIFLLHLFFFQMFSDVFCLYRGRGLANNVVGFLFCQLIQQYSRVQ